MTESRRPPSGEGLPLLDRILLAAVRGRGAEFVVGDVVERFRHDVVDGIPLARARRRLRRQTVATALRWWFRRTRAAGLRRGSLAGAPETSAWLQDVRISARNMRRRPGFAAAVILTLALGVGATSTMYAVVDAVLLRPLRYPDAQRLVAVGNTFPRREWDDRSADLQHLAGVSVANWLDYRERMHSLATLVAAEPSNLLMPGEDGPELVTAARISDGFLEAFGVSPLLGRDFAPEDHGAGGGGTVLLSYGAWMRRFGGDPGVLGRRLGEGSTASVIVGVLPPDFRAPELFFPSQPEFWLPLQPGDARYADRSRRSAILLGRLAPGVTLGQARAEARSVAADIARAHPDGNAYEGGEALGLGLNELRNATVGSSRRVLLLFLAASGLLLLIACLNAATLLLARSLERAGELGIRAALGAGRSSLMRLVVSESVLLSALSGVLGIALGYGGVAAVHRFGPSSIPRLGEIAVDGRVLGLTALAAVAVGVVVGLFAALRPGPSAPGRTLRRGMGSTTGQGGSRLRSALVVGQVALAVVLLSGAGLLFGSVVRLRAVDPGFDPRGLLTFQMPLKGAAANGRSWQAWDEALAQVAAIPGVEATGGTSNVPYQPTYWSPWVRLPDEGADVREATAGYSVTPGYLNAVGTRLLDGRGFDKGDGPEGPWVVLVNEAFVRGRMAGRDGVPSAGQAALRGAVGRDLRFDDGGERMVRIVGVVEDVIQERAEEGHLPAIYVPYTQSTWPFVQVAVRSDLPTATVASEVRKAMARVDPSVPVLQLQAMDARMAATRTDPRFRSILIGFFATLALLLASTGLYGSLAHAVSRRRRELGIRVALGATRGGVVALVVGQGLRVTGAGLAVGLTCALLVARFLRDLLFGVTPTDPWTYVTVAAVMGGVAAMAAFIPARRATGVDPVEVLTAE